jgi:hypothetical protein
LFYRSNLLDRVLDGRRVSFEDVERADNLVQGTLILYVLGFLTTGIVFIVWQYRFAKNAERLTGPLGLRPGWAIGGWFIPLAAPVLAAIQLDQADRRSGGRRPHGDRARPLVIAWLVAWYLGVIVFVVATAVRPDYDDNDIDAARDFVQADRIAAAGFALIVAAGVLAVLIVRKVSARQHDATGGA